MQDISPESPEARAERGEHKPAEQIGALAYAWQIVKRVVVGVFSDGFIHAGNLAYLALLTLFPFCIVTAAVTKLFGQDKETLLAIESFLHTLPPDVARLLEKPIEDVLVARTGSLLWLGALVGLWTVGSFIETIRDIFRRAYGTRFTHPFWRYRLGSVLVIVSSVVLALVAFLIQGALTAVEQFVYHLLPWAQQFAGLIGLSRLIPGLVMFGALWMLFLSVTPSKYRAGSCRTWPGALFTTIWWTTATALLPIILSHLGSYDLTYGSLAGVIIALFFFWIIGLGIVIAAHLNAALAESDRPSLERAAAPAPEGAAAAA